MWLGNVVCSLEELKLKAVTSLCEVLLFETRPCLPLMARLERERGQSVGCHRCSTYWPLTSDLADSDLAAQYVN